MRETRHSVCALDCPDTCSVLVTVEDGRAIRLRGNPDHPVTRGFLCGKVARYLDREYHPNRLLYPQRRIGAKGEGRFARITWDEALDEIAARLKKIAAEFGPDAVLPYSYAGTMGLLNGSGMDRRFFHRLGASRLDRTICSTAGGAGLTASLGFRYGTEPEQFRNARLIIAWGANVLGTIAHLWSLYALRSDGQAVARGINSIQAIKEAGGWRVAGIMVQAETAAAPLPEEYLP
jgi:anaerobic selenocysteine-containing dehydrogenase